MPHVVAVRLRHGFEEDDSMGTPLRTIVPRTFTLLAIAQNPGLSVNDLAERLEVPQQTAKDQGKSGFSVRRQHALHSRPLRRRILASLRQTRFRRH